ncbi:MAG TPA: (Fe-S)-binding protein [Humidesulfovibrio sp.]|uniref:(Fe-S)-binding protein n=1 Tax=Humidesulfovibrio sp. TaxID=2910988 RepID=UPI002C0D4E94|nr:(Fe-S)-binding protein [Humidesulfovibrio sp.]HWR04311.1 (Fe-S)-binding protein [Humidesulfovibrio sp.]
MDGKATRAQAIKAFYARAAAGRSLDEQLAAVRETGGHGAFSVLRAGALAAQGITVPKPQADVCLVFGCYRPFTTPQLLGQAVRLFGALGMECTWLPDEVCCGLPLVSQSTGDEREAMLSASRGFIEDNRSRARDRGAQRVVYCCAGCAQAAKGLVGDTGDLYLLDALIDALQGRKLVGAGRIAYFEGCHTSYKAQFPAVDLNWKRYREFLGSVPGLELFDVSGLCCKHVPGEVVERALAQGAQRLVCACSGCVAGLRAAAQGRIALVSYPELLLETLGLG